MLTASSVALLGLVLAIAGLAITCLALGFAFGLALGDHHEKR